MPITGARIYLEVDQIASGWLANAGFDESKLPLTSNGAVHLSYGGRFRVFYAIVELARQLRLAKLEQAKIKGVTYLLINYKLLEKPVKVGRVDLITEIGQKVFSNVRLSLNKGEMILVATQPCPIESRRPITKFLISELGSLQEFLVPPVICSRDHTASQLSLPLGLSKVA